jgi:hypothetical protein
LVMVRKFLAEREVNSAIDVLARLAFAIAP